MRQAILLLAISVISAAVSMGVAWWMLNQDDKGETVPVDQEVDADLAVAKKHERRLADLSYRMELVADSLVSLSSEIERLRDIREISAADDGCQPAPTPLHGSLITEESPPADRDRIAHLQESITASRLALDEELSSEERDMTWAPGKEQDITNYFRSDDWPGVEIGAVECHTSMCRLALSFRDEEALNDFTERALQEGPISKRNARMRPRDAANYLADVSLFVKREGESFKAR